MTPDRLERMCQEQWKLLDIGSVLVRPGGALVYAVCSVIDREGRDQIHNFLERNPGWNSAMPTLPVGVAHGDGLLLTPYHDETDGFFIARMARS
jgi:16S rRNA (cytosine967-C5)-methyltransferase